ncbi:MAG TPA: hypothetical protein VGL59_10735 [Polyangia bacterium]|jgi:hypothetical protein
MKLRLLSLGVVVSVAGAMLSVVAAGCGSSAAVTPGTGGNGGSGTGGIGAGTGGVGADVPHRPVPVICAPSRLVVDAGTTSCNTDSECGSDAGFPQLHCVRHACTADQCLIDDDCPADSVCGCSDLFGGNAVHTNQCVPSTCHVDADCTSGLCSPASGGYCGSLTGYHCRGATDTCHSQSDCPTKSNGGIQQPQTCQYTPEVARWQCTGVVVCSG